MRIIRVLQLTMAALVLFSCGKESPEPSPKPSPQPSGEVKVTGVSLNKTEITLTEGDIETLTATVTPDNATNKTVTWSSSNTAIATVQDGKVTAIKEGVADIIAKAGDKQASCKITVKKKVIAVSEVTLDKTELPMLVGQTQTLVATVVPDNATDKTVTWESSAMDVASVENGLVTALKVGTATITAKAQDKTATCTVKVIDGTIDFVLSSTDAAILKAAGGSSTATLTTSDSWTATSSESWLTISPVSGDAGETEMILTTASNANGQNRTAKITVSMGGISKAFEIKQRADVFTRTKLSSGKVTQGVKLSYNGTQFSRIYILMPHPVSNFYQDISNYSIISGATEVVSPDGLNHYLWRDASAGDVPQSGDFIISDIYDANVYRVTTDFSKMDDIPAYDPNSEECKNYLGKESNNLIDPTHSKIVSTASSLWNEANGNLIEYAHKCHDWTYANMKYGKMNTGLHTIDELMKDMTGDCGNYSSVFISLLRAKGIPSRHVVMVDGNTDDSYHVRAEFYIPGYGWVPSDPTWGYDYFGVFDGKYIVMTRGINTYARDADGKDMMIDLFQTFYYWYWYSTPGSNIKFSDTCLGLN